MPKKAVDPARKAGGARAAPYRAPKGRGRKPRDDDHEAEDVEGDYFEDDYEPRGRRDLDDVGTTEVDVVDDDEISSSEDEDLEGMPLRRKRAAADDDSDEEQSIGSSVDEADLVDLSHMLEEDDDDDEGGGGGDASDDEEESGRAAGHADMLSAVGLRAGQKGGTARGQRTEALEEGEYA
eukprot:3783342-Prymnesium_polylepis.1